MQRLTWPARCLATHSPAFVLQGGELYSHATIFEQIKTAPLSILAVTVAIIGASAIPIFKGSNTLDDGSSEGTPGGAFGTASAVWLPWQV